MTAEQILEAMGGHRLVAKAIGRPVPQVWRWKVRGIPTPAWADIVQVGKANGITFDVLARHTAPGAERRKSAVVAA